MLMLVFQLFTMGFYIYYQLSSSYKVFKFHLRAIFFNIRTDFSFALALSRGLLFFKFAYM